MQPNTVCLSADPPLRAPWSTFTSKGDKSARANERAAHAAATFLAATQASARAADRQRNVVLQARNHATIAAGERERKLKHPTFSS